jgi:Carboxypeptidase regulatory-like domain/Cupin domain
MQSALTSFSVQQLDAFMRIVLLLSLLAAPLLLDAQTPAPPQPAPPTPQPAPQTPQQPAPAAPKPAVKKPQPAARTALVVTTTTPDGKTLPGIRVEVMGAADRSGETDGSGTLRFANMRPGTYRVRLSGPGVITLEREVVVRAGQTADLDVTLNAAPEQPPPEPPTPEPAPQAAAPQGPPGEPKVVSILDLLEKEFVGRQPRRETLLGCSVNLRAMMIQLNESMPERLYEGAEAAYYVLGGEGTIRLNGRESALVTGSFALVPRGTAHAFIRKGKRPLILLSTLSGEPCQANP